jgi:hypothetical protein
METSNKETDYIVRVDDDLKNYVSKINATKEEVLKASETSKDMLGYKVIEGSFKVNGVIINDLCPKPTK